MNYDLELLRLRAPVGKGQQNDPDDVETFDNSLRKIDAYSPPAEYVESPQRYPTEPMIAALERFQEQNGLRIDAVAKPGGPTERAINNRLLNKPRGAGLLYDPPAPLAGAVGNGFENRREDVANVQRRLGALDFLPEDPFDQPHGFIDEATTNGLKAFQRAKGLADDGWLAPGGETERALGDAIREIARVKARDWLTFAQRASQAEVKLNGAYNDALPNSRIPNEPTAVTPVFYDPRGEHLGMRRILEGGFLPRFLGGGAAGRTRGIQPPPKPPNPPVGVPIPDGGRPSTHDATIHPRLPNRSVEQPQVYVPEPGSPLRIPILDVHRFGPQGKPETRQSTKDVVDAIQEQCTKAFKGTRAEFKRTYEEYYRNSETGKRRGSSFADGLFRITIGGITIDFVADTYTPKVDASPNAAEQSRFMKLERNMEKVHGIVVRVPKPWALGHVLDKEKLSDATKEICEQIRKTLDKGELDPDKDKLFLQKLLEKLTRPKRKSAPAGGADVRR